MNNMNRYHHNSLGKGHPFHNDWNPLSNIKLCKIIYTNKNFKNIQLTLLASQRLSQRFSTGWHNRIPSWSFMMYRRMMLKCLSLEKIKLFQFNNLLKNIFNNFRWNYTKLINLNNFNTLIEFTTLHNWG